MDSFHLTLPNDKNMFLAVDDDGQISYMNEKDQTSGKDSLWTLIKPVNKVFHPEEQGFYLVSSNNKMVVEYDPKEGEKVRAAIFNPKDHTNGHTKDHTKDHTVWYVSPESEIYCYSLNPEDGLEDRRYLWSVLKGVYVTPDEYLAEKWIAKTTTNIVHREAENYGVVLYIFIFILICSSMIYIFL